MDQPFAHTLTFDALKVLVLMAAFTTAAFAASLAGTGANNKG